MMQTWKLPWWKNIENFLLKKTRNRIKLKWISPIQAENTRKSVNCTCSNKIQWNQLKRNKYTEISVNAKNFHACLMNILDYNAGEIWTKLYGPNYKKSELFDKKMGFLKPFLTKCWHHCRRCFCSWYNCLMLKYWFPDYHLSVFQNYGSLTCVTKHGRPD